MEPMTQEKIVEHVDSVVNELEMKIAFQEYTIEKLNDALSDQQQRIDALEFKLRHVVDRLRNIEPSNIAKLSEETPPPHY